MNTQPQISVERTVHIPPEQVWPYISNGALWARWQGESCEIEPVVGGRFAMTMPDGEVAAGTVTDVVENKKITFTWGWVGSPLPPGSTTVEITLHLTAEGGTRILLTHDRLPEELIEHHRGGWESCLTTLTEILSFD